MQESISWPHTSHGPSKPKARSMSAFVQPGGKFHPVISFSPKTLLNTDSCRIWRLYNSRLQFCIDYSPPELLRQHLKCYFLRQLEAVRHPISGHFKLDGPLVKLSSHLTSSSCGRRAVR